MKLLLVLIEGQIYLAAVIAIFAAELALLVWGLWSRRPIVGLIAVFAVLPLVRTTIHAISVCFIRARQPGGIVIGREDARLLFALVDETRTSLRAPAIDLIVITGGFSASASIYRPRWRLRPQRALVLGLPALTTLSSLELRSVIAHELAHYTQAHDAFAAWVYRTRRSWLDLRASLDSRRATPLYVYWLIHWYVPRLNRAAASVSRRHELVADRVAADVAGSRATADALVAFEAGARFAELSYWPGIQASHEKDAEPPRPYSGMLTWNARFVEEAVLQDLLRDASAPDDTHPSLNERFVHLGEHPRVPPPIARSAGEELFGVTLTDLARRLDDRWVERNGDVWRRVRAEHVERMVRLERLAALEAPSADDRFARATLVEDLEGRDAALPLYQSAAVEQHPAASLAAGRILLERMDDAGVALVEDAMSRDERLVADGCRLLADYCLQRNQPLAASRYERRARRHATLARLDRSPPAG